MTADTMCGLLQQKDANAPVPGHVGMCSVLHVHSLPG